MPGRDLEAEPTLGANTQEIMTQAMPTGAPTDSTTAVEGRVRAFALNDLYSNAGKQIAAIAGCRRSVGGTGHGPNWLMDCFGNGNQVLFLELEVAATERARFSVNGSYGLVTGSAGGWLLQPSDAHGPWYWLPRLPVVRTQNKYGHILSEAAVSIGALETRATGLTMEFIAPSSGRLQVVTWAIPCVHKELLESLRSGHAESCYLWGSHSRIDTLADVYVHLVHGSVYESRFAWPHQRKIFSENDAHALYVALSGLFRSRRLPMADLLRQQLVLSVLARQGDDGAWRHGEWTDHFESHFRLHCSAMHMLMDVLDERDDPIVRAALTRAADFVARQTDTLDCGTWLLHDELELSESALLTGPGRWLPSRALGKSVSNLLVLNSHLDTTIALDRYGRITGDRRHAALVSSANQATETVLALRPAESLYRFMFRLIGLTFLPTAQARTLPLLQRALKRLSWKYLIPMLPSIKRRFPRFVMPGGYVDRELSAIGFAHDYHAVNLMDLARHQRCHPSELRDRVLSDGLRFVHDSGLDKRWKEMAYHRYALGFWAEALYQAYLFRPDAQWLAWLAGAVQDLEDLQMGLPASLLGANAECTPVARQRFVAWPDQPGVRAINLSRDEITEILLVNCSNEAIPCVTAPCNLAWSDADGAPVAANDRMLPPRGWMRGVSGG